MSRLLICCLLLTFAVPAKANRILSLCRSIHFFLAGSSSPVKTLSEDDHGMFSRLSTDRTGKLGPDMLIKDIARSYVLVSTDPKVDSDLASWLKKVDAIKETDEEKKILAIARLAYRAIPSNTIKLLRPFLSSAVATSKEGEIIKLGTYLRLKRGTCVETATLLQLGLQRAGIESTIQYGEFMLSYKKDNEVIQKNPHVWQVVTIRGEKYLLDGNLPSPRLVKLIGDGPYTFGGDELGWSNKREEAVYTPKQYALLIGAAPLEKKHLEALKPYFPELANHHVLAH